jgi:Domain of unknown function (DUF1992)
VTEQYESWIDRQIREAQERGEFDNLPGAGKPLPDHNELNDEDWWVKGLIHREGIRAVLPTTLKLRKDIEDLPAQIAKQTNESAVRNLVTELNQRILKARRGPVDGPPTIFNTIDVDEIVRRWRERPVTPE